MIRFQFSGNGDADVYISTMASPDHRRHVGRRRGSCLARFGRPGRQAGLVAQLRPAKTGFPEVRPENNGPRILVLGCLRDVDTLIVLSEQDLGIESGKDVTLTLENGTAQYVVQGKFEPDGVGVGQAGFTSEIDADAKALPQIRSKLLPVLEGKGPIVLTVGSTSRELPVAGLLKPLSGFKSVCFGQR